jgi:hypothetical protein
LNAFLATGSPLPFGGLASASYVIPQDGTYYTAVSQGLGEYVLELQVYRPILESESVGAQQVIFLDFDGETLDASIFGVQQTARLSPMRDFLDNWGLTAADENAVIDACRPFHLCGLRAHCGQREQWRLRLHRKSG